MDGWTAFLEYHRPAVPSNSNKERNPYTYIYRTFFYYYSLLYKTNKTLYTPFSMSLLHLSLCVSVCCSKYVDRAARSWTDRQVMEHLDTIRWIGYNRIDGSSIHDDDRPVRWSLNWPTGCLIYLGFFVFYRVCVWLADQKKKRKKKTIEKERKIFSVFPTVNGSSSRLKTKTKKNPIGIFKKKKIKKINARDSIRLGHHPTLLIEYPKQEEEEERGGGQATKFHVWIVWMVGCWVLLLVDSIKVNDRYRERNTFVDLCMGTFEDERSCSSKFTFLSSQQ